MNRWNEYFMKLFQYLFVGCALAWWLSLAWIGTWSAQEDRNAADDGASIKVDGVPLTSAIRNLARQMECNIIIDPAVPGAGIGPGRRLKEPMITGRRQNMSPEQELRALLREHQLVLVTNPVTTVVCVIPVNLAVVPVPASAVDVETNKVIPLIVIENAPLLDVLRLMGKEAGLKVAFDRKLTRAFERNSEISIRWENLTARQALAALIDNYGLVIVEEPAGASAEVRFKGK